MNFSTTAIDPVSAATAEDPYPYYAALVRESPFYFDDRLKTWIASSSGAVEAVLSSPAMRVRPPGAPVPPAIDGTTLGEVFRQLVRMTDGDYHTACKAAVSGALDSVDVERLFRSGTENASHFLRGSQGAPFALLEYAYAVPIATVAALLGFQSEDSKRVVRLTRAFARGFAPDAANADIARANEAVTALLADLPAGSLLANRPNAAGLLFQTCDATAALIAAAFNALADGREHSGNLRTFVAEVARYDSPVQNTRRFAAGETVIAGESVAEGQAVLAVLAAANRDPSANPEPHEFDPARTNPRLYTFGFGIHACPGARIAIALAHAAVACALESGLDPRRFTRLEYAHSSNLRTPVMVEREPGSEGAF